MILGIDEVGRGPWAGPLVFGAVVLGGKEIDGLTDSKKLSKKRREELDVIIRREARGFGLGWVSATELDEIGMSKACELGCRRAIEEIKVPYHEIIIDGTVNFLKETGKGAYVTTIKQADLLIPSVSAASILAKVARDAFMEEQDMLFPGYGFKSHVGYGTKAHREALDKLGITPLHRMSFAPIAAMMGNGATEKRQSRVSLGAQSVTSRAVGDASETCAAEYLHGDGFRIVARNWRTRLCEIDIVAYRNGVYYFVEVKHRTTATHGDGIAAITPQKLKQMKKAAELYALKHKLTDVDLRLMAVATFGEPPQIGEILQID